MDERRSRPHQRGREEAAALERLVLGGRTLAQIGGVLSRTEGWVSRRLRVYSDSVLAGFVIAGGLPTATAEELLTVKDIETRKDMALRAVSENWSQDKARGEVRALRIDRQIREIGRQARGLLELLSSINASQLPTSAAKDLNLLQRRITTLAHGKPVMPSIEAAQRAAGVNPDRPAKARRTRLRTT